MFIAVFNTSGVTIGFVETEYDVNEAAGTVTVEVAVLSGELSEDVPIDFTTQPGTATST